MSLSKAVEIAKNAHRGQKDKGGHDYFTSHIVAVMNGVDTEKAKIVAALHDTVEDTNVTIEYLETIFDKEIVDAVRTITHKKNEPYFDYIERIKTNELATMVKISDLKNNMDLSRIPNPTEKDFKRVEKYERAMEMLK